MVSDDGDRESAPGPATTPEAVQRAVRATARPNAELGGDSRFRQGQLQRSGRSRSPADNILRISQGRQNPGPPPAVIDKLSQYRSPLAPNSRRLTRTVIATDDPIRLFRFQSAIDGNKLLRGFPPGRAGTCARGNTNGHTTPNGKQAPCAKLNRLGVNHRK